MHPSIKPISQNINLNYTLVIKIIDELDDDIALRKATNNSNCLNWILGHLVRGRHVLGGLAGIKQDKTFWAELYGRGSIFSKDKTYPKMSEIRDIWIKRSESLDEALTNLLELDLTKKCPYPFPIKENNILEGLGFLVFHENYHIGQVSILRQEFGLKRLFD